MALPRCGCAHVCASRCPDYIPCRTRHIRTVSLRCGCAHVCADCCRFRMSCRNDGTRTGVEDQFVVAWRRHDLQRILPMRVSSFLCRIGCVPEAGQPPVEAWIGIVTSGVCTLRVRVCLRVCVFRMFKCVCGCVGLERRLARVCVDWTFRATPRFVVNGGAVESRDACASRVTPVKLGVHRHNPDRVPYWIGPQTIRGSSR